MGIRKLVIVREWGRVKCLPGKEMGRAMKFFRIKMKNKMSIVKGNPGKKVKK